MQTTLGIDVGSTTAKVVVATADGELLFHRCERHRGHPRPLVDALVAEARDRHAPAHVAATGTLGVAMAADFGAVPVHEVRAVALAVRARHPRVRCIVELGGQDAKILFLGREGASDDTQMNDRCAAGTGATLDRIAARLDLSPSVLATAHLEGDLRVAAKCGVFAETDVVNARKRGASDGAVVAALARAIVVQNLAVLARGRTLEPPVLLLGGPHAHLPVLAEAWREALAALWGTRDVAPGPVEVPPHAELFAALGAALHVARGGRSLALVRGVHRGLRELPPLREPHDDAASIEAVRRSSPRAHLGAGPVPVHLGIDAGSTTAKAVALSSDGELLLSSYGPSSGNPVDDVRERLTELLRNARARGAELLVQSLGVTGYGAQMVAPVLGADAAPVETIAHARAALRAAPDTDVVVDVGGTDVKVLRLEGDAVADFHVSNQCAAGHGAFLATAATDVGVPMDRFADHAFAARRAPRFTVGCAVFLDTDRVTFRRNGYDNDEILAGLAWSLARNVWELVVPVPPERLGRRFLLTGGAHRNAAVAWAQTKYLSERVPGARVTVHETPELCGARGAALVGMEAAARAGESRFVGLAAACALRVEIVTGEPLRCTRCELACARSVVRVRGGDGVRRPNLARRLVVGHTCERGADEASTGRRSRRHAPDLFVTEATRLFHRLLSPPRPPSPHAPVIGIPRVMALYRSAPLLLHYLEAAGVPRENLVLSPTTSEALFHRGAHWGAHDPCFPGKLVLSHVDWLLEAHRRRPLDFLFMPALPHAAIAVRGTADTASCPIVAATPHLVLAALRRNGDVLTRLGIRPLVPELSLVDRARLDRQLFETFGPILDLDRETHERALAHGLAAQRAYLDRCRWSGARLLLRAARRGQAVAVILGRPYHADPGVQHGVSTELAARGIPVLGIASLPDLDPARADLSDLVPAVTNSGCAEKMWAARVIAAVPHLVAVDLSSFRCGQDASVLGLLTDALEATGRPVLRLHDMDEDRPDISVRVRIDTFADAVRRFEAPSLATRLAPPRVPREATAEVFA